MSTSAPKAEPPAITRIFEQPSGRSVATLGLRLVEWLAVPAAQATDTAADTLRHRFLVMTGLLMSGGGVMWGTLALAIGAPQASLIPFSYVVLTALNLLWLRLHRSFRRTRVVQLSASLVLPFCFQCALGGFEASGAMMLWGLLALVGALTFLERRGSLVWLVLYLSLLTVSGWMETTGALTPVTQDERVQAFSLVLNIAVISSIVFVVTSYFVRSRESMAQNLAAKSMQYEDLLYRTLPPAIVDRLRHGETAIADAAETAAVLFVDIVGFSSWARHAPPLAVVTALGDFFRAVDELTLLHGMEKIKTIGDAYMAVCGVPQPSSAPSEHAAQLALAILEISGQFSTPDGQPLVVRIGMDEGPLAAGVISQHKLVYDVWGATVNFAARLESTAAPGTIHVSARVRDSLGSRFVFEAVGPVDLKGIGTTATWQLRGPQPR